MKALAALSTVSVVANLVQAEALTAANQQLASANADNIRLTALRDRMDNALRIAVARLRASESERDLLSARAVELEYQVARHRDRADDASALVRDREATIADLRRQLADRDAALAELRAGI